MAKKTHLKVRMVPESNPDSKFIYYAKKPTKGEKAKDKLKLKKYNPNTRKHEYFVEKKLYPNVDFYSGIILKAIGFPVSLFTVIFAVARTVGWISHWNEMISDQNSKIGRPRQLYTGKPQRELS